MKKCRDVQMQEAAPCGLDRITYCLSTLRELWSGERILTHSRGGWDGDWLAGKKMGGRKLVLFGVTTYSSDVVIMLNFPHLNESVPAV